MTRRILFVVLALAGCKDKKSSQSSAPPTPSPSPVTSTPPPVAPEGDVIDISASHHPGKASDPVHVELRGITVKKAAFTSVDDLTGGSAELTVDLTTLTSGGQSMRENHLKSADYFDVANQPSATIAVSDVKKIEGDRYSASAEVTLHGVTVKWPVEFVVVDKKDKTVRVRGTVATKRSEFKLGKPEGAPDETTADAVSVEIRVSLTAT